MKAPIHRLSKNEILWLSRHRCKHKHTYLAHYSCFLKEGEQTERIGFFDIETNNLDANFGTMLSYCIKDGSSDKIFHNVITKKDIEDFPADKTDKRIVRQCIEDLGQFDRVVAHYGKKFDIPYLRTRALICGLKFPAFGELYLDDTWQWAKNKLKLNSNRLEVICRTILGETQKTHIEYKYWVGGTRGDEQSLRYILDHNKKDVLDLERVWKKLRDFVRKTNSSI